MGHLILNVFYPKNSLKLNDAFQIVDVHDLHVFVQT